jgi:membrane protein required for colicin V production
MNYLDIIIIVLLVALAIQGYRRGLIKSLASLAALVLGIWGGIKLSGYVADVLVRHIDIKQEYLFVIGFIVVFIVVVILVSLVGKFLDNIASMAALSTVNKLLGMFFGIAKGALILSVIISIYHFADPEAKIIKPETRENSILYQPIGAIAPILLLNLRELDIDVPSWDEERSV